MATKKTTRGRRKATGQASGKAKRVGRVAKAAPKKAGAATRKSKAAPKATKAGKQSSAAVQKKRRVAKKARKDAGAEQITKELRQQWSDRKGAALIEDYIRSGAGSKHFKI